MTGRGRLTLPSTKTPMKPVEVATGQASPDQADEDLKSMADRLKRDSETFLRRKGRR